MPRQRKPAEVMERKGAFRHDPARRREDVPATGTLPETPPIAMGLSDEQVSIWRDIVDLVPPVAGKANDIFLVEMLVRLIHKMRTSGEINAAEMGRIHAGLNALCLTPPGRAALAIPAEKPKDNPADEFRIEKIRERKYLGSTPNAN